MLQCCNQDSLRHTDRWKAWARVAQDVMEDIDRDRREWNLNEVDPCDKDVWRSSVRSVMHAASQLPGRSPLMWMMLLHLHVNLNANDDMIEYYGFQNFVGKNLPPMIFYYRKSLFNVVLA